MSRTDGPRVVFYARVADLRLLDLLEFYSEDLKSLEDLGCNVVRTNSIAEAIRANGDLLYAWWWHSSLPVIAAWRLRGRRVVATGASTLFVSPDAGRARWFVRFCATAAGIRLATMNIAVSQTEAEKIRRIRSSRLACIPHAVDTGFFVPGVKATAPLAIVVAQLNAGSIKRKGVDTAVRAVEKIRESLPTFRLILAGPVASDGEAVLALLRRQVDFTGIEVLGEVSREEKRRLLGVAWLCLQPSIYEGFGVSVLEAMACGAVPICSSGGALPEVVGNGGIVLPVATPAAVARAVQVLVGDPVRLRVLAGQARVRAETFDSRQHTKALAAVLRDTGLILGEV